MSKSILKTSYKDQDEIRDRVYDNYTKVSPVIAASFRRASADIMRVEFSKPTQAEVTDTNSTSSISSISSTSTTDSSTTITKTSTSTFDIAQFKAELHSNLIKVIKTTSHSRRKRPFSTIFDTLPTNRDAIALFSKNLHLESDTYRMTKWYLYGNENILSWFGCDDKGDDDDDDDDDERGISSSSYDKKRLIYPVKFDDRRKSKAAIKAVTKKKKEKRAKKGKALSLKSSFSLTSSSKKNVCAFAAFEELEVKLEKKNHCLTLKARTYVVDIEFLDSPVKA